MSKEPVVSTTNVTIKCPLCEKPYPINLAMLHSAFACMNCGTLIRASGMVQPDLKPLTGEKVSSSTTPEKLSPSTTPLSRRDTQTISRGDTTQIERPEIPVIPKGRRTLPAPSPIDPLDLDEIANSQPPAARVIRKRGKGKDQNMLTVASIVAVCGAVLILLVVVVAMAIAKSSPTRIPAPVAEPAPPPAAPVLVKTEDPRVKAEREWADAYRHAERLKLEIAANKVLVSRLAIALKESTTKHFADAQRELEAARAKGRELVDHESRWRAEYVRLGKELGK